MEGNPADPESLLAEGTSSTPSTTNPADAASNNVDDVSQPAAAFNVAASVLGGAGGDAPTPTPTPGLSVEGPPGVAESTPKDVTMTDGAADSAAQSPAPPTQTTTNAPSPLPARTGTPMRQPGATSSTSAAAVGGGGGGGGATTERGESGGSRGGSALPDPGFAMPSEAPAHGAPVRQYLNAKVTGPLLEGMKMIAKEQPKDPLRVLGEYLLQRSKELEATSTSS